MKRFALCLTVLLCLFAFAPLVAQTPIPGKPWVHGTEEFIVQGQAVRTNATGSWSTDLQGAWAHYVSGRTQVGAAMSLIRDGANGGYGAGPYYEFDFAPVGRGQLFLGGDAQALAGQLDELATVRAATRIGWKVHLGTASALRLAMEMKRAVNESSDAAGDQLNQVGLTVGLSLGVTP